MQGGVVTDAHALDVKDVTAYESAGGFAGEMFTGGAAEVGNVDLAGLDLTGSLGAVQTFVPVVRNSSVSGYQSGMFVKAWGRPEGTDGKVEKTGYAGGYVGHMIGGQIWGNYQPETAGDTTAAVSRCETKNLRRVDGTNAVGGFAGRIDPGSAAALDTAGSSGLLGGLLQSVIGTPGDLLSVLNATLSTIRAADVKAWDPYGILINGVYQDENRNTAYAKAAGGFAGEINGAVIGEEGKEGTTDYHLHLEFDTDVTPGYATWSPQVAGTGGFWKKGVDSTVNPSHLLHMGPGQSLAEPTYNPAWLNPEDCSIPVILDDSEYAAQIAALQQELEQERRRREIAEEAQAAAETKLKEIKKICE